MISSLWANSNWDDTKESKGHRQKAIDDLNEQHHESIEAIDLAFSSRVVPEEKKLSDDNPFFAAADRGLAKVEARITQSRQKQPEHIQDAMTEETEEPDFMKGLDQE